MRNNSVSYCAGISTKLILCLFSFFLNFAKKFSSILFFIFVVFTLLMFSLYFAKTLVFAIKFFAPLSFKKADRGLGAKSPIFYYSISAFVPPAKFKSTHSAVLKCFTLIFCKNTSILFALSSNTML